MVSYQPQCSRSNLILGDGKPTTRRKGQENVQVREREEEWEKNQYLWAIDQIIKMAFFKYSSRIITILSISKSKFSPK